VGSRARGGGKGEKKGEKRQKKKVRKGEWIERRRRRTIL
jgi:hypothetical protein